uniref:Uncharacterized protein n=1 Tax=Arundo donax TaxID=35708 RepID=A0A0A9CUT5_ARUDO
MEHELVATMVLSVSYQNLGQSRLYSAPDQSRTWPLLMDPSDTLYIALQQEDLHLSSQSFHVLGQAGTSLKNPEPF